VDPRVAYLQRWDVDVEIILLLSKTSKEYAISKVAEKNQQGKHVRGLSQVAKIGQYQLNGP
jgi:hypothetical protein